MFFFWSWFNVSVFLQFFLKNIKNKIVLICSPDIDFPPPKYPYKYDKYFDSSILPSNYLNINYYDKINLEIISVINENNLKPLHDSGFEIVSEIVSVLFSKLISILRSFL